MAEKIVIRWKHNGSTARVWPAYGRSMIEKGLAEPARATKVPPVRRAPAKGKKKVG